MSASYEYYVLSGRVSLRRADYSSREVLTNAVCLSEIVNPR